MDLNTTAIVGERILTSHGGPSRQIVVRVLMPVLDPQAGDYQCAYQIAGEGLEVSRYAAGLDAIQAIQLAFMAIGAHLDVLEVSWGTQLRWSESESNGFGS